MGQEKITLTQTEMKKVLVVEKILDGRMTNKEGAIALGLSERQGLSTEEKISDGRFTGTCL